MWNTIRAFYNSKDWIKFRMQIIEERSSNGIYCEYCGKGITAAGEVEIDHVKELTLENVNDYTICLNPENVKIACHNCHNKKHDRFVGFKERKAFLIYGPPLSGKYTYVKEHMVRGDMVIDIDRLFQAITYNPLYDKPEAVKYNVFAMKNLLLDNVKTRYGKFRNAWIVGGYANKIDRERLGKELGAEMVFINTPREECIKRLDTCNDYRRYQKTEWKQYIDRWFDEYIP